MCSTLELQSTKLSLLQPNKSQLLSTWMSGCVCVCMCVWPVKAFVCFLSCSGECGDAAGIGDAESAARGESLSALGKAGLQLAPAMCKSQWVPQHSVQEASRLIDWDAHHQRHPSFIPTTTSSSSSLLPPLACSCSESTCASLHFFFSFLPRPASSHTQQASPHPPSTNKKGEDNTPHLDGLNWDWTVFFLFCFFVVVFLQCVHGCCTWGVSPSLGSSRATHLQSLQMSAHSPRVIYYLFIIIVPLRLRLL